MTLTSLSMIDRRLTPDTAVDRSVDRAAELLELRPGMNELLKVHDRELGVQLPLRRDDGSIAVVQGYRVQHNGARGPYLGGLRLHPRAGLRQTRALASLATWRSALHGLPFGGAQGSLLIDPADFSTTELEALTRRYALAVSHVMGPRLDVAAPDLNTDARAMAWFLDAYGSRHGHAPGVVAGKPLSLGGVPGGEAAAGRGLVYVLEAAARRWGLDLAAQRVAIHGFGHIGSWVARELYVRGVRVVAIGDAGGACSTSAGSTSPNCSAGPPPGTPSPTPERRCSASRPTSC